MYALSKLNKQNEQTWVNLQKRLNEVQFSYKKLFPQPVYDFINNKAVSVGSCEGYFVPSLLTTTAYLLACNHARVQTLTHDQPLNIYTVFVGYPGTGKSSAIQHASQNHLENLDLTSSVISKTTSSGLVKLLATQKRGIIVSPELCDILNKLLKSDEDNATGDIQLLCKLFSGERSSYHYSTEESRVIPQNTPFSILGSTQLQNAAKLIAKMDHGHGLVDRMLIATPLAYRPTLSEMERATQQLSTEVVEDFGEYFQNVSETADHIRFTLSEDAKLTYRETIDQFAVKVNTAIQQGKVPPKSKIPELVPRVATALHVFNHTMNELLSGVPATAPPTEISNTTLESAAQFVHHLESQKDILCQGKDSARGSCLHVSLSKGDDSPVIYEKLESFGFKVIKESSITTAAKLCSSTKMALIVLEDCEDKKFIEAIKSPKSWNEHTPIVFISSGPLSDSVRHLMQEQYIDELVFKCLTLECDLGSAVNRLITQPGQFAVTPKSKRPGIVRKRKLETAFSPSWNKQPSGRDIVASPTSWRSAPSAGHLPMGPPMLHGSDYSQNTYNMNPFMMPLPPVHQQQQQQQQQHHQQQQLPGSVEPKINFHPPGEHRHYGGISYTCSHTVQLPPYSQSESKFHPKSVSGRHNVQTTKQHCAQQHMHITAESGHAQNAFDQWQPPVIEKFEKQQSVHSDQNNKDIAEDSKKSEDCEEKNIQFERKMVCKPKLDRSPPGKGSHLQTASPSSTKKRNAPRQERNKQKSTGSTSLERKVQHLDKEKQRRERITKSWHWLRQLVPNCDAYADKATVFEMSVAYLHHCWKYHGPLVQNINKEFSSKQKTTIPPEDMESIVTEVIEKETKAFGNIGLQSRSKTE